MDGQCFLDNLGERRGLWRGPVIQLPGGMLRPIDSFRERLSSVSGDSRETTFLYQRLSVLIQIFNSVVFRGTLLPETVTKG